MTSISLLNFLGYVETMLCVTALCLLVFRKQWREYWAVGWLLAVRAVSSICLALIVHEARGAVASQTAYRVYFYVYWGAFAIESILALFILYSIFRITTTPLKGLQRFGMLVLGTLAVISVLLALGSTFASGLSGMRYIVGSITQLQRTQSILTVGLVLFVFLATRPMGLSYRSKVFGVSLGLAITAIADLGVPVWITHNPHMNAFFNILNGVVLCATLAIWAGYFAMREPARREIVLPASSVFVRLNRMGLGWFG